MRWVTGWLVVWLVGCGGEAATQIEADDLIWHAERAPAVYFEARDANAGGEDNALPEGRYRTVLDDMAVSFGVGENGKLTGDLTFEYRGTDNYGFGRYRPEWDGTLMFYGSERDMKVSYPLINGFAEGEAWWYGDGLLMRKAMFERGRVMVEELIDYRRDGRLAKREIWDRNRRVDHLMLYDESGARTEITRRYVDEITRYDDSINKLGEHTDYKVLLKKFDEAGRLTEVRDEIAGEHKKYDERGVLRYIDRIENEQGGRQRRHLKHYDEDSMLQSESIMVTVVEGRRARTVREIHREYRPTGQLRSERVRAPDTNGRMVVTTREYDERGRPRGENAEGSRQVEGEVRLSPPN